MTALVLAAWIAATVARLAAALRRLADAVAPLTVEAPRPVPAPAAVASRATQVRIAPEARRPAPTELHYVRDYHTTICGGPLGGASRATGSPQMWHAEPPATRCPTCAAELRRADPHRFDTRLQGITDTRGDADELLRGSR